MSYNQTNIINRTSSDQLKNIWSEKVLEIFRALININAF